MRKNCKTFEQWIESMYQEFDKAYKKSTALQVRSGCRKNTRYTIIFNTKTKRSACETISLKYSMELRQAIKMSTALAWASYKGEEIPDFKKRDFLGNLENGASFTDFEGSEYIKIGYNPLRDLYVCAPFSGDSNYRHFEGSLLVYTAN